MTSLLCATIALLPVLLARSEPYLGGALYMQPYVYVAPVPMAPTPVVYYSHEVGRQDSAASAHDEPEDEEEVVSQFHTEDGHGRVFYGFHGPQQARMEARDSSGKVKGSYSYIDPLGQIFKMEYWDEGEGFHARGMGSPGPILDVPSYTPEVQAAREQHFKLFQQILMSNALASSSNGELEEYPYVEQRPGGSPTSGEDEDSVVVGNSYSDGETYNEPTMDGGERFGALQDEEDTESVALDNPEFVEHRRSKQIDLEHEKQPDNTPRGFSYQFQHPLTHPVQSVPLAAAVHDQQQAFPPQAEVSFRTVPLVSAVHNQQQPVYPIADRIPTSVAAAQKLVHDEDQAARIRQQYVHPQGDLPFETPAVLPVQHAQDQHSAQPLSETPLRSPSLIAAVHDQQQAIRPHPGAPFKASPLDHDEAVFWPNEHSFRTSPPVSAVHDQQAVHRRPGVSTRNQPIVPTIHSQPGRRERGSAITPAHTIPRSFVKSN